MSGQTRREMLKSAAIGGAALAVGAAISPAIAEDVSAGTRPDLAPPAPANRATMKNVPFDRMGTVRFGIVGTGLRGRSVLSELLAIDGARITAVCDVVADKTVMLQHDVCNPRPYTRHNRVQGTKGAFEDYPPRIYIDGQAGGERWGTIDEWKAKFTHPLWAQVGELAKKKGGHGGMDFIMAYRLVQTMREGLPPDYDVYDAAAWSAPFPLSEMSLARGSAPIKFPDFTRGAFASARVSG